MQGVTQFTAGLHGKGHSGALNVHVSDVFASMIKQWHLKQTAAEANWLIDEDVVLPGLKGTALRSMKVPGTASDVPEMGKDPQPAHSKQLYRGYNDNGGVHRNCGITNLAFYLIAVALGGHSWERAGKIWFSALTDKSLRPSCTFKEWAQLTVSVAERETLVMRS